MRTLVSELEREDLPQIVGPYLLVDLLGTGAMGRVFRARSLTEDGGIREHALKVLRDDDSDGVRRALFVREARIGRLLDHANLVRTHDYFVHEDERFLVMELVEGRNLTGLLEARHDPLPPADAAGLVAQAARGVHAAHVLQDDQGQPYGLVHRDLKPDNVLVGNDGVVRVADFGIAKPTRQDMTAYVTEEAERAPRGTLPYMSPEQLRGQPLDARSDVWALGGVLFYAMTGQHLFGTEGGLAVLYRILRLDFAATPQPYRHLDELLPGAGSVLRRCVALEADDRFSTAEQLAEALDILADESRVRRTLAMISGRNLPDWMAVPLDQLEDPRTAQAIPVVAAGQPAAAAGPAVRPLGADGVQGRLAGRDAVVMRVIPARRPGRAGRESEVEGPRPEEAPPTRTEPDDESPRARRREAAQTARARAHADRSLVQARTERNLWFGVAVVGVGLLVLVAVVVGLLALRG